MINLRTVKNFSIKNALRLFFVIFSTSCLFSPAFAGRIVGKKNYWTIAEDKLLLEIIHKFSGEERAKEYSWDLIAREFNIQVMTILPPDQSLKERSYKSCRERYLVHLQKGINKSPISPIELDKILELVTIYGTRWTKIAEIIKNNRRPEFISNIYYCKVRSGQFKHSMHKLKESSDTEDTTSVLAKSAILPAKQSTTSYSKHGLMRNYYDPTEDPSCLPANSGLMQDYYDPTFDIENPL